MQLRAALLDLFADHLSLTAADGGSWRTAAHFPFMHLGEPGVFNISAAEGLLGVEVRPVPEDDLPALCESLQRLADEHGARLELLCQEAGISCPADNRYRAALETAVADVSGQPAVIGKKLAGTSARFAPGGNAVIWGQSGCGPHARDERHFIPSILPYLAVLDRFADSCRVLE